MSDTPKVRVLHYTPYNEDCGVAIYQQQYIDAMATSAAATITNTVFPVSPLKFRVLKPQEQAKVLDELAEALKDNDILHIQHEFGLFKDDDFLRVAKVGESSGKKVIISLHLSPEFAIKPLKLKGLGPRSFARYAIDKRNHKRQTKWHVKPFLKADLLLVHNGMTATALEDVGADPARIVKIPLPAYQYPEPPKSELIAQKLNKKPGDIIYCMVGILHRYKGLFDAVKALKFLPDNYKLAIVGGMHPISDDLTIYNKVCDLIDILGLQDRVYITGFVKDDNQMNAYIRECDVCVFPYDGTYYSHVSSGAISLSIANHMPVIVYPTRVFKELAESSNGAIIFTDTFAYYELSRELQRIDLEKQTKLSKSFAEEIAWPKAAEEMVELYQEIAQAK